MRPGLSDKRRLLLSFGLIISLFVTSGALTVYGMFALGALTETIYRHPLVVSNASLRAAVSMTKMHRDMKDVVLAENIDASRRTLRQVQKLEHDVYRQLDLVRDNILGESGHVLERETRRLMDGWAPIRADVVQSMERGNTARAIHITRNRGARHVAKLERKMLDLTTYARKKADGFHQEALHHQRTLEVLNTAITSVAVLFSIAIALLATRRVTTVHAALNSERHRLEKALAEIKTLQGIIPICSHCRQIRDDEGVWKAMEEYIDEHSDASFSHGICPDCLRKQYPDIADSIIRRVSEVDEQ